MTTPNAPTSPPPPPPPPPHQFQLVIARHAKAAPNAPSGLDADRPLLPRGRRQADHLARELADRLRGRPARLVASPAARTDATAQTIAQAMAQTTALSTAQTTAQSTARKVEHDDRLFIDRPIGPVLELIAEHSASSPGVALILVGHNPALSRLVGLLALGPGGPAIDMKTGMAVVLEWPSPPPGPDALPGSARVLEVIRLDGD